MEMLLEARKYLEKVEEIIKASKDNMPEDKILHCTGVTNTGLPIFYECEFSSREPYEIDTVDEDNVIFILSDGSIVQRNGQKSKKQDNNLATSIIEGNEKYKSYYHMRYGDRPVSDFALEALIKHIDTIYIKNKTVYIPQYAGAFTTPISALWRIALKYSDLFSGYIRVYIKNLAENPECHIKF